MTRRRWTRIPSSIRANRAHHRVHRAGEDARNPEAALYDVGLEHIYAAQASDGYTQSTIPTLRRAAGIEVMRSVNIRPISKSSMSARWRCSPARCGRGIVARLSHVVAEGWRNFATKRHRQPADISRSSTSYSKNARRSDVESRHTYILGMRPEPCTKCTQSVPNSGAFRTCTTRNPWKKRGFHVSNWGGGGVRRAAKILGFARA